MIHLYGRFLRKKIKNAGSGARAGFLAALTILYMGLVVILYPLAGPGTFAFSFLVILCAAFLGGKKGGLIWAAIVSPYNYVAGVFLVDDPAAANPAMHLAGLSTQFLLALAFGHMRDLSARLKMVLGEKAKAEREARHLSLHDMVTGLPNRRLLRDRMQLEMAHASRENNELAVLFIDLDGFKTINDRFGHDEGDRLLRRSAEVIVGSVRQSDTVARTGGDEFVVLLPGIRTYADAFVVSERMIQGIRRLGAGTGLGASIGVAVYPHDGKDASALVQAADRAMYRAKENGKNATCCRGEIVRSVSSANEFNANPHALERARERRQSRE